MALYTLEEATTFHTAAKEAYLNALSSKSYTIKDRAKYNQEILSLRKEMDKWAEIVNSYSTNNQKACLNVKFS